ncbi:MAG: ribose 5-phosphate isomerase B [Bacteroidia bacterium]|nr:ribose 5-phosphate isomerase B [Bacteroidia bacterium]
MSKNINLAIGCDHAGYQLKEQLKEFLEEEDYILKDFGTYSEDSTDYPDYAHSLAESVEKKEVDFGILMCGSGNGINMTANKHQDVRAALCWKEELAKLARQHNDANIISLPARFISFEEAKEIVTAFLNTAFEGGRHEKRVNKINC